MLLLKQKIKTYLLSLLFIFFIFHDYLQNIFSIFSYFDEIIGLAGAIIFMFVILTKKIKKDCWKVIVLFILFAFLLIVPTVYFHIQSYRAAVVDLFLLYKFFFSIIFGIYIVSLFKNNDIIEKILMFNAKLCSIVFILYALYSVFFGELLNNIIQLEPIKLFYSQPLILVSNSVVLISIFLMFYKRKNLFWIFILMILMALTLTTKAYLAILVILIILINKKIVINKTLLVFMSFIGVAIISYDQVIFYFVKNTHFARAQLLIKSFAIANDFFPFGAGLATYGSYQSQVYYSPLYHMYGLDTIYGLSMDTKFFISDSFWPMILGEAGYFGVLVYLLILISLYKFIMKNDNKSIKTALILLLGYLLIASTNEAAFVHYYSIPMGFLIGMGLKDVLIKR